LTVDLYPYVTVSVGGEVREDIDRLLHVLLPRPVGGVRPVPPKRSRAAVVDHRGRLRAVRPSGRRTWRDRDALSARLDRLVAADSVRALGHSELVVARYSNGRTEDNEWATQVRIEHRDGFSYDFIVPVGWSRTRRPFDREPSWIDRLADDWPYRCWPGGAETTNDLDHALESIGPQGIWRSLPAAYLAARYRDEGDYDDLLRAVDAARLICRLTRGQPSWPAAANELACLLAAQFRHAGDPYDIDDAVRLSRRAREMSPRDVRIGANLAAHLGLRFQVTAALSDLEAGVEAARAAARVAGVVDSTSEAGGGDEVGAVVDTTAIFAKMLIMWYGATAERRGLFEAIDAVRRARLRTRDHPDGDAPELIHLLGVLNLIAFEESGIRGGGERAVKYSGAALSAIEELDPRFLQYLTDHGTALLRAYQAYGDERMLAHAHYCFATALSRIHVNAPNRVDLLLKLAATRLYPLPFDPLGRSLHEMEAERRGAAKPTAEWASVTMAMEEVEQALADLPDGAPERHEAYTLLASAHLARFRLEATEQDLRAAVAAAEQGVSDWTGWFAAAPVAQKFGAGSQGQAVHAVAVEALLALAGHDADAAPDAVRRAAVLAEATKSRVLTEQLSRTGLPAPPGVRKRLANREQVLITEIAALDTAALAARDTGFDHTNNLRRRAATRWLLDLTWQKIAATGPPGHAHVSMRRGEPLSWPQIREIVNRYGRYAAVVSVLVLRTSTVLFIARAGTAEPTAVEVDVDERAWVEATRRLGRELPRSQGLDDLPVTWRAPVRPVLDAVAASVAGCDRVIVVPHASAHGLPWTLLSRDWVGRDGQPPVVSTVPALALLDRLHRRPPAKGTAAVVVGNPTGDLPQAEAEAHAVASILGSQPLTGSAATRAAVTTAVPAARTLHLACHAGFQRGTPLDSYITLADGPWYARDALTARLNADLLVLSGCETGISEALSGDELAGITQAFLHAGARTLVVSLWPVDDASTAVLMRSFHEHRHAGADVAQALAAAAERLRRLGYHPWHWAAFQAVGDTR
jgi:hypothetical protein